jgi:hypothetical protein
MLVELYPLRRTVSNFFAPKAIGTYVMVIFIPVVFYSYTSFTGKSIFPVDITTFVVAVVIGQIVSYKLMQREKLSKAADGVSIFALIVLAVIFVVFTFYPPHLPIFQDPNTGQYGV